MNRLNYRIFPTKEGCIIALSVFVLCSVHPDLLQETVAQSAAPAAEAETFWLWKFLGRLHPLAVHFPVSLLLFAAVLELFTFRQYQSKLRPGINLLVYIGAISAIIAAGLGLLLFSQEEY